MKSEIVTREQEAATQIESLSDTLSRVQQLVCDGEAIPIMEAAIVVLQGKCACARCLIRTFSAIIGTIVQYVPAEKREQTLEDAAVAQLFYSAGDEPNRDYQKILGGQCMKPLAPEIKVAIGSELMLKLLS